MLEYILKTSICWLAFYAIYYAFLRKETFFKINRAYLLTTLCLGAIIPLKENLIPIAPTEAVAIYIAPLNFDLINESFVVTASPEPAALQIDWLYILFIVYVIGVMITLARFLYGLSKIYNLYEDAVVEKERSINFVRSKSVHVPFSFFNLLFISDAYTLTKEEEEKIILHETAHIRGMHSYDVILAEVMAIIFWCSPFIYPYKKSIKTVHEYLADDKVLQTTSTQSYGRLLLSHSQAGMQVAMANHFIHSQLKQRIIMMTRNKSTRKNLIKYALIVPVLLTLVLVFAQSDISNMAANASLQPMETNVTGRIFSEPENFSNSISAIPENVDPLSDHQTEASTGLSSTSNDTAKVFKVVEQMPRFPGCEERADDKKKCAQKLMLNYIYSNIKYPSEARTSGVQGTTVVRFIVDHTGKIKNAKVLRDIGAGCGGESLRVVNSMPNWVPGMHNGNKVDVQYNLPIKFKLQNEGNDETSIGPNTSNFPKNVEQMPRFPGCEEGKEEEKEACAQEKLFEFIFEQVKYPNEARIQGVQGMTVIKFVVDETGKIINPEIVKEIGAGCGEESLRVVKSMPDWIPGKENGKAVAVEYTLPFKFALDQSGIEHAVEVDRTMTEENAKTTLDRMADETKITPRFPGCENITGDKDQCANQKMYAFIYENMNYPNGTLKDNIEGEIRVRFSVTQNGKVINPEISKGISKALDNEVLRVIDSMPKWIPGVAADENLSVTISVPISFNKDSSSIDNSQKAFIDGKIHPLVKDKLKSAYGETYESDVALGKGFTKEDQKDYILTFKAIEMTMKEYDKDAVLKVGTGEGENKSEEEWLRHFEKAFGELHDFADDRGGDEAFKKMFQRVGQNKTRISYGQK